jgi:hypothetical protein
MIDLTQHPRTCKRCEEVWAKGEREKKLLGLIDNALRTAVVSIKACDDCTGNAVSNAARCTRCLDKREGEGGVRCMYAPSCNVGDQLRVRRLPRPGSGSSL